MILFTLVMYWEGMITENGCTEHVKKDFMKNPSHSTPFIFVHIKHGVM